MLGTNLQYGWCEMEGTMKVNSAWPTEPTTTQQRPDLESNMQNRLIISPSITAAFHFSLSTRIIFDRRNNDVPAAAWLFSLPPFLYEIYFLKQTRHRGGDATQCARYPTMSQNDYRRAFNKWHTTDDGVTFDPASAAPCVRPPGGWPCRDLARRKRGRCARPSREVFVFFGERTEADISRNGSRRRIIVERTGCSKMADQPLPASLRWLLLLLLLLNTRFSEDDGHGRDQWSFKRACLLVSSLRRLCSGFKSQGSRWLYCQSYNKCDIYRPLKFCEGPRWEDNMQCAKESNKKKWKIVINSI